VGIDGAEDEYELAVGRVVDLGGERVRLGDRGDGTTAADGRALAETRDRFAYFDQLQAADGRESGWDDAVLRFRERWAEHQERWPASGRDAVDRSTDPPGSWRGDSGRYLDAADNAEVDSRCERIAEAERTTISPAMRAIEAADPSRELVGWDHRLKGPDRTKEKIAETLAEQPDLTAREAAEDVPDCLRFTFSYNESGYTKGVIADIGRLKDQGFEMVRLKNYWESPQYRGINSQWREADTGVRFEVQFHTPVSYEAKQLTHGTYERLRARQMDPHEELELEAMQRDVSVTVPRPPSVERVADYPERRANAG